MTINSPMNLTKHTDDVTVDYWEWWRLSDAEKEYFTTNIQQIGERPTIISLNSWKYLPIPSIQTNDIRPQQRAVGDWDGTVHMTRNTGYKLNDWLTLSLREELIAPKRAYFLRIDEAHDYFPHISDVARTYISFFRWKNIIFILGSIIKQDEINDADLRQVYAWLKSQSPPPNLRHLGLNMHTSRRLAHQKWLDLFGWNELIPEIIPDEAAVHLQLPNKIKGFSYVHRGYAQLYAVTDMITAKIHPDAHGADRVDDYYEWDNHYCIIINIADLADVDDIRNAIRVSGKQFHDKVKAPHPHVHANGGCCWGGYRDGLNTLLQLRDVVGIFHVVQNFCQVIDPDSLLEQFPEIKEDYGYCGICESTIPSEDDSHTCDSCETEVCCDCSRFFECCDERYCNSCADNKGGIDCRWCDCQTCDDHSSSCEMCCENYCDHCMKICEICTEHICQRCSVKCARCDQKICKGCAKTVFLGRGLGSSDQDLCNECREETTFIHCGRCKKPVFEEAKKHGCAFCGVIICTECTSAHLVANRFFLIQSDEERHVLTGQAICDPCFKDFLSRMGDYLKKIDSHFIRDYPIKQYIIDRNEDWLNPSAECICGRKMLQSELEKCTECQGPMCGECSNICEDCCDYICNDCMRVCDRCEDFTCKSCGTQVVTDVSPRRMVWQCKDCTQIR